MPSMPVANRKSLVAPFREGWHSAGQKSGTATRHPSLDEAAALLLARWRDEGVEYDFVSRSRRREEAESKPSASAESTPPPYVGGYVGEQDWFPENLLFELKSHPPLSKLPSFQQGFFYIQDPSTLLAVHALDPKSGETILDLCAAPGGKLSYIAQLVRNEARVIAHDVSSDRLKLIEENCARLGVTCVQAVLSERGVHAASTVAYSSGYAHPSAPKLVETGSGVNAAFRPGEFDRILVDAPCSNTGVLRRRVDLRWRIKPEEIIRLRQMQLDLLSQAAPLLKPGGTLVYSTCSLEPQENEEVVQQFLQANSAFTLEFQRWLLPFVDATDGAFVAKLLRG